MRQEWLPEELIESWTLVEADWKLVGNKSGATRLGFSLLLKFYEVEGRFPGYPEIRKAFGTRPASKDDERRWAPGGSLAARRSCRRCRGRAPRRLARPRLPTADDGDEADDEDEALASAGAEGGPAAPGC
jgi:hypothetical protein